MAVLSLNRLPVVDAAGDVFAYVLEVEGGSDQDVAELLAGVVARYSIDGITTGRAVLLPGRLPVLALEELDGATAPEVAFTVSEQQLSDLPTAEALHAQRARRRKVFVFRDRATRRADVMAFYGDATSVRPLAFASTIKEMKGLLHNA